MMKISSSKKNSSHVARCPITGQVGVCPSMASVHENIESSSSSSLSSKDQQAKVWESLMNHPGNSTFVPKEDVADDDSLPKLEHASSLSFSPLDDGSSDCSGSVASSSSSTEFSPFATLDKKAVKKDRAWPTYDQVSAHVLMTDYNDTLTNGADLKNTTTTNATAPPKKMLCPHGTVCQAKIEFFPAPEGVPQYTGLLTPGTTAEHCLIRLSSAIRPVDHGNKNPIAQAIARRTFGVKLASSQILPAMAIKLFRDNGVASGNILAFGSKVGQASRNFFQHALCTAVTEKIPSMGIPFLRHFSRYSKYPLTLGLSELSMYDAQGRATPKEEANFPFALCLQPVVQMPDMDENDSRPFDAFIEDVQKHVPAGTHLFDIYVAPTPEAVASSHQLQRIGRIVSTSSFIYSSPTDGLTFRHQTKEEDLALRSDWEERMHSHTVRCEDGSRGTVSKMTGWQIFEEHILGQGDYVDFEKAAKSKQQRRGNKAVPLAVQDPSVPGWTFCGFRKAHVEV